MRRREDGRHVSYDGLMGGKSDFPRMTRTRGGMPKAMGEVMMKYRKMMEGGSR